MFQSDHGQNCCASCSSRAQCLPLPLEGTRSLSRNDKSILFQNTYSSSSYRNDNSVTLRVASPGRSLPQKLRLASQLTILLQHSVSYYPVFVYNSLPRGKNRITVDAVGPLGRQITMQPYYTYEGANGGRKTVTNDKTLTYCAGEKWDIKATAIHIQILIN